MAGGHDQSTSDDPGLSVFPFTRTFLTSFICLGLLLMTSSAAAQQTAKAKSRALFIKGMEAQRMKRHPQAAAAFEEAYRYNSNALYLHLAAKSHPHDPDRALTLAKCAQVGKKKPLTSAHRTRNDALIASLEEKTSLRFDGRTNPLSSHCAKLDGGVVRLNTTQVAQALFQRGMKARRAKKHAKAAEAFEKAYRTQRRALYLHEAAKSAQRGSDLKRAMVLATCAHSESEHPLTKAQRAKNEALLNALQKKTPRMIPSPLAPLSSSCSGLTLDPRRSGPWPSDDKTGVVRGGLGLGRGSNADAPPPKPAKTPARRARP